LSKCEQALALARIGFWVFPIVAGKKAPPRFKDWQGWATREPGTIGHWWVANPDDNIGISTSAFGDGEALLVVDVDTRPGKDGNVALSALEADGFVLTETREHDTPTGGSHIVYRVPAAVRQSAGKLGVGLDTRSSGGYIVAPGSTTKDGAYTVAIDAPIALAPQWLVDKCGAVKPKTTTDQNVAAPTPPSAVERATHYLEHDAPLAVEGQAGDETTFKVAARMKDLGVDESACVGLMAERWNDRCSPPWDHDELGQKVKNAYAYGREAQGSAAPEADFTPVVQQTDPNGQMQDNGGTDKTKSSATSIHPFEKLNAEYAFILAGGGDHILWETTDHDATPCLVHLNTGSFHRRHLAWEIQVGKKTAPVTEEWMRWKGRRSYDGLVFMPERPAPERFYNLWQGFAVKPSPDPVDVRDSHRYAALNAFLEHARLNICRGDQALYSWLIGWFAHLVQRPWEKPLVALVMRGGKGVGKNALVRIIGVLLGRHSITASDKRYLVGNFNGHMESLLLFTLDEAFWSGDKQAEGRLKDLITGDRHLIEHKGEKVYEVANLTRVVIIGNEEWLVPASHDERRFAVFDVGDGRKGDNSFFIEMREGMEQGGYSHLLRYLLDYPLGSVDVSAAPSTTGLLEQKHATLEPFAQWWFTCLQDGQLVGSDFGGEWPPEVECERFRSAFRRYFRDRNVKGRIPDDRSMGRQLAGWGVGKKRLQIGYVYVMPELVKARKEWDGYIGHEVVWE
jgi:hypothetical protein